MLVLKIFVVFWMLIKGVFLILALGIMGIYCLIRCVSYAMDKSAPECFSLFDFVNNLN